MNNRENRVKELKTVEECCSIANNAGKRLREELDAAEEQISDVKAAIVKQIRSKPIQSGLIATAAGFMLGALWRR